MKRITIFGARISLLMILLVSMYGFSQPVVLDRVQAQASPEKYTVLVGAEDNNEGVDAEYFYPANLHIHIGDTVVWKQNSAEIHTVTFLAGSEMPDLIVPAPAGAPSPAMINPIVTTKVVPVNGKYNGAKFANSGLMGKELRPGAFLYAHIHQTRHLQIHLRGARRDDVGHDHRRQAHRQDPIA